MEKPKSFYDRSEKIRSIIMKSINNFNEENIIEIKKNSYAFFGQYNENEKEMGEFEMENKTFVNELKAGIILKEKIDEIIEDMKSKIDLSSVDYITFTPDSGNYGKDKNSIELQWFSKVVQYIAERLEKEIILPEIVKEMWKQKEQTTLQDRLNNRLWAYIFDASKIKWRNILFIDDVLTTGATMLAIARDVLNKEWLIELYFISNARKD